MFNKKNVPSVGDFASLGKAVTGDPDMQNQLREKFIAMNDGDPDIDSKKLATKIIMKARAKGVRKFMPRPVVQKLIESVMSTGADDGEK